MKEDSGQMAGTTAENFSFKIMAEPGELFTLSRTSINQQLKKIH